MSVVARPQAVQLGNHGSIPARAKRIFLYTKTFTPALEPTEPPVEWVSDTLSSGYGKWNLKICGEK